jgi:PAS domain S-box-containing protein
VHVASDQPGHETGGDGWARAGVLAVCGALTIGSLALAGWASGVHALEGAGPGLAGMKANSAVALVMCSLGLLVNRDSTRRRTQLANGLGMAAAAIGVLTLLEYAVGGLGIDQLVFHDPSAGGAPGRAAPHTAAAIVAAGAALAAGACPRMRATALSAAMLAVLLGIVGYAYQVSTLTGANGGPGMAPNTLVALMLIVFGLVAARPASWPLAHLTGPRLAATMSRRLTGALVALPLAGLVELELQRADRWSAGVGIALFAVTTVGLLAAIVAVTVRSLDRLERQQLADQRRRQRVQRYLASIVDSSSDAVIGTQLDGTVRSWNAAAERLYGWTEAAIRGRDIAAIVPPESRPQLRDTLEAARRGETRAVDAVHHHKDGHRMEVALRVAPIVDADGQIVGAATTAYDGSARARADRRFRDLLDAAPDAIVVAAQDGTIVIVNRQAVQMFGHSSEELVDQPVDVLVPALLSNGQADHGDFQRDDWARDVGTGMELFALRKDGLEIPVEISLSPLETDEGQLVIAAIRDITERRSGEERLRAAARFFEIAHDLLCTADADGYFVELNGAWEQTLGWTLNELRSQPAMDFVHPDDRDRTHAEHARRTEGLETDRFVNRFRTKDGGWRCLEWTWMKAPDGELTYASARDVTERVDAERALREAEARAAAARDEALAASRMKSSFLANMSHEIRTPLNGVLGITDVLLDGDLSAEQREHAELIRISGDTLLTVVDDILDLSKIEAGALRIEHARFDLVDAVEGACMLVSEDAARKGLGLTLSLDAKLPAGVLGDAVRVRQVLGNLLSNAVKFSSEGEIRVSARCTEARGTCTRVMFVVEDAGIGIEASALERLFEPFVQADASTTRRFGGTGLGLAIVAQLVRMMDGDVGASSTPGEGSTFWFSMPFERAADGVEEPELEPPATQRPRSHAAAKVLVVEDNSINQTVATELARQRGCQVEVAHDGLEALEALRTRSFDLVLMDCQMPRLDGYEATRRLRGWDTPAACTPVVAMTANAMPGDRQRCLDAGMNDYIAKPIRGDDLDRVLARFAARGPASGAMLDPDGVADLRARLGDSGVAGRIVEVFAEQTQDLLAVLRAALERRDAAAVAETAHKLKGSCLTLAATRMGELCAQLDARARSGILEDGYVLVDEIAASFAPTYAAMLDAFASD